jgi:pyruvyltransferase
MDASGSDAPPLRVFWWKGVPNFGDALSADAVAYVSGRRVIHAGPGKCDLFAAGSILQVARRNLKRPRKDGVRPWIWGSGLLHPVTAGFLERAQVALLRGPVTAALLGFAADAYGDPGLLAPEVYGVPEAHHDRIGLVVHHAHGDDPELAALVAAEPALVRIDVRGEAGAVCRQIAACRHVIASSLHGLIVADAYGVPSTWLAPRDQSALKYIDYGASVGRDMATPVALADIPALLKTLNDASLPHEQGIARAQEALKHSFPASLRAAPDMAPA